MYEDVSKRLTIKEKTVGHMDYEDTLRMKQIAKMITDDIDQTLRARKEAREKGIKDWTEDNPLAKDLMEKGDPGAIRGLGAGYVAVLADRWSKMENPVQRKAEMAMVGMGHGMALYQSQKHGFIPKDKIPPFFFTIWARKF